MNKKGFTLVELLAVIVILAIILAIAVPSITGLLEKQRENSFESNVKMLIRGIDYKKLELSSEDKEFTDQEEGYQLNTNLANDIADFGGNPDDYQCFVINSVDPITVTIITKSTSKFGQLGVKNATLSSVTVAKSDDEGFPEANCGV